GGDAYAPPKIAAPSTQPPSHGAKTEPPAQPSSTKTMAAPPVFAKASDAPADRTEREPAIDLSDSQTIEEKPQRPQDLFFQSSTDEVTLSAPAASSAPRTDRDAYAEHSEYSRPTASGEVLARGAGHDRNGEPELDKTGEGPSLDFLDSTLSRPTD